jgi:hypothetical protein
VEELLVNVDSVFGETSSDHEILQGTAATVEITRNGSSVSS